MRTLLLTLTTCLLALPANAKYSGGSGTAQDPYRIATAADLIALGETPADYDKHFLLTADIDLDPNLPGRKVFDKAVIAPDMDMAKSGFQGNPFTGVFDGNGHTISNFIQISTDTDYTGLFAYINGLTAEVKNLGLISPHVDTQTAWCVGALVGRLDEGTIGNCYVQDGNVSGRSYRRGEEDGIYGGLSYTGGLVGISRGTMSDCRAAGSVFGSSRAGGLVGISTGTIVNCTSSGNVSGNIYVGGLLGWNHVDGEITDCYAMGNVSGKGACVGGLVGVNTARIVNSYARSSVSGSSIVGGLVGCNGSAAARDIPADRGEIINSYSTGAVSGTSYVGGLVGRHEVGAVMSSFWDMRTSGQTTSDAGEGKTTAQMQTAKTFLDAGWDFVGETKNGRADIWWILDGQDYPRLAWERVVFDDFADGKAGPLWTTYEPQPERVRLREVHGRLEVEVAAQEESVDAFYASNGWRLKVSEPFALRVDFHFGKEGTGNGRMNLGLVPSLDPAGMRWAEFEAGCFDTGPIYLYEVRDGDWVEEQVTDRSSDSGTLYMSYNPDTDELYFSTAGYGKPNAWKTVRGLLKGRWAGGPVYVILSGGSAGMALTSGDAWFDNFTISTGVIVR